VTTIVLVRHGQTEWNRDGRFRGRSDVALDPVGRAQAQACARRIAAGWRPSAVYSSPLSRAVHTAQPIAEQQGLKVSVRQHLIDLNFGDWEGLKLSEARLRWPDLVDGWLGDPGSVRPPRGEGLETLRERALAEVRSLARAHAEETIVVVSHDALNRVLVLAALDAPLGAFFRVGQDTAAINVLSVDEQGIVVEVVNDTCHLQPASSQETPDAR